MHLSFAKFDTSIPPWEDPMEKCLSSTLYGAIGLSVLTEPDSSNNRCRFDLIHQLFLPRENGITYPEGKAVRCQTTRSRGGGRGNPLE